MTGKVDKNISYISSLNQTANEISATVKKQSSYIDTIEDDIASLKISYNNISSTVTQNINSINSLTGQVTTNTTNISKIEQTAKSISSTVKNQKEEIDTLTGKVNTNTTNISKIEQTAKSISSTVSNNTTSISNINNSLKGLSGQVITNTNNISNITQTATEIKSTVKSQKEEIDTLTGQVNTNTSHISEISQRADSIEFKVDQTSIKLAEGIELNGDTVVNGSVTINDKNTGFILNGDTGTTQITADSIGDYSDFYNKANTVKMTNGSSVSFSRSIINSQEQFSFSFTKSLGKVNSGKNVKIKTSSINFMKPNSGTVLSGSLTTYKVEILEGSTVKVTKSSTSSTSMNINTSFTSSGGELKIRYTIVASFSKSYWDTSSSSGPIEMPSAQCNYTLNWEYANDCFQMIGYDGHAINFGNGCVDYFGPQMSIIKYGNYAIKLSNSGLQRYVTSNVSYNSKSHVHGSSTYTDTITSAYVTDWCPINGYAIRKTSKLTTNTTKNIYIDIMDDVIEIDNTAGMVNVFLGSPTYFTGKRIVIKKIANGGDMDVYAGYSTSQTSYRLLRGDTLDTYYSRTNCEAYTRAYFSDGTIWIEEWLGS